MDGRKSEESAQWADDGENWEPEGHPDFAQKMPGIAQSIYDGLKSSSPDEQRAFLLDTRSVHRKLYEQFVPPDAPYFAGTYRGVPGTKLELYWPAIDLKIGEKSHAPKTCHPKYVADEMDKLAEQIGRFPQQQPSFAHTAAEITTIWRNFLKVHPYANGNGHVSRLMLYALARLKGLGLKNWTINPNPYPDDVKVALAEPIENTQAMTLLVRFVAFRLE